MPQNRRRWHRQHRYRHTEDIRCILASSIGRHSRHLRAHIDQLADKTYRTAFDPCPEFVALFVPGAPFLDAALGADAGLPEYAFGRNVILATPTTLLRTITYGWRQKAPTRAVATIQQLGRELYTRLSTADRPLDRLGAQLGKAVGAFNHTVSTMRSRVMVTARRLHDLDIGDREVLELHRVQAWPRTAGYLDPAE
jgi:DNA recombination protein RmuC